MNKRFMNPPSPDDLIVAAKSIMEDYSPHSMLYLDQAGKWKKNPETLRDCVCNEILFYLWRLGDEKREFFIRQGLNVFLEKNLWSLTKKIASSGQHNLDIETTDMSDEEIDKRLLHVYSSGSHPKKSVPFLIVLEGLCWVIVYEAMRSNSRLKVPSWDSKTRGQQQEINSYLQEMTNLICRLSPKQRENRFSSDIYGHLNLTFPEFLPVLTRVVAEEYRIDRTIRHLLERSQKEEARLDILSLVIERILPPMGIVTQTSPALLRPCIRLLLDPQIDIESGIQYNASVILSILKDPRSTEALLHALGSFSPNFSKIRENVIYTLGNLREQKAVGSIASVLKEDDKLMVTSGRGSVNYCLLLGQKEEAMLALGKIGLPSLPLLPTLISYAGHPSFKLQTYLAWTLGEIGRSQKNEYGGVSADIIITLLELLKTKNKKVFEESVHALKKIQMPEFIHSLYLYNVGAVNILGLKPAQKGLYELSETIHFLIKKNGQAIIAVNGDSGTGKTYFCQSLMDGFGDIEPKDILYMMRDRKRDQRAFNRILGLKWLKKYIDPVYYHDYPLHQEEDDPESYLDDFLKENEDKKLIILDGCRDRDYFQRVIDLFYFRGRLDVEINFRATQSTRRFNLEEREIALESVRSHLSFLEEPALEDTYIYREGKAILYDLDNSIHNRLVKEEIQELFSQERIESWGELIRIGDFKKATHPLESKIGKLSIRDEPFTLKTYGMDKTRKESLSHEERKFHMELNRDISNDPHLIGTIDAGDLKPEQIRFYAQNQIAGLGKEGVIFILTFLDNRIFSTVEEECQGLSLLGRKIFSIERHGEGVVVNFEKNEKIRLPKADSPILVSAALSTDRVITGHRDGSIAVWDLSVNEIHMLQGHDGPVRALASDYYGRIYSISSDSPLKRWDLEKGQVSLITGFSGSVSRIELYPENKILAVTENSADRKKGQENQQSIILMDLEGCDFKSLSSPLENMLSSVAVHFDGRIFATYHRSGGADGETFVFIAPGKKSWGFKILDCHGQDIKDCLIMGPRLITCGTELNGSQTIRLWGTDVYVRTELNKLIALSERT